MTDEQLRDKIFNALEGNEAEYIGGVTIGKNDQLMKELWAIAKFYHQSQLQTFIQKLDSPSSRKAKRSDDTEVKL